MASEQDAAVLAGRLRVAMARLVRRIKRETAGAESVSAISALAAVKRLGAPTVGELADAEGISRPSASAQADSLEERELLTREGADEDRRLVRLRLTADGLKVLDQSRNERNAWLARRLRHLSEVDLHVLEQAAELLERLDSDPA